MNTDKIFAEAIANEYSVKNTSKVIALKKLDRRAKLPANVTAYSIGILSALVMGAGMCFSMKVIGAGSIFHMVLGIVWGIIGITGASANYFVYKKLFMVVISQPTVFRAEQSFLEMYQKIFSPIFDRYHFPDWEKKYRISFYMNGIWAIIEEWLRADCSDDIEKMMQLLMSCVYGGSKV